jgi:hypothetical protein
MIDPKSSNFKSHATCIMSFLRKLQCQLISTVPFAYYLAYIREWNHDFTWESYTPKSSLEETRDSVNGMAETFWDKDLSRLACSTLQHHYIYNCYIVKCSMLYYFLIYIYIYILMISGVRG